MEARRLRAGVLARLHADLDHDPDPDPARDRRRDRPSRREQAPAVHRGHWRACSAAVRDRLQPPLRHGADRRADRSADAGAPLPRLPGLPPRVLRPARDRTGALAGDERPVPHPLLHRLGARAGDAERDDDRRGRDRPRHRRPAAALYAAVAMPPIGVRRQPLRAPRLADLAPGAGAEGRRHRGGRRGGRRHRDGAGLRPRERRARALRRAGPRASAPPRSDQAGVEAQHLPGPLLPARALDRRRRVLRRPGGHPRRHHDRRVRPLRDAAPPARLAARGDRLDPRTSAQRALASAGRSFAWLDGIEPLPEPTSPRHLPAEDRSASASSA